LSDVGARYNCNNISDTESGLFFVPLLHMTMFKEEFYAINEKFNDKINSPFNSVHCSILSTVRTDKTTATHARLKTTLLNCVIFCTLLGICAQISMLYVPQKSI
jgi:hypothetical protein